MTDEEEDTDVGFPGPEHHIAERDLAMKVPMAILAFLAVVGGVLQIPGVDDSITRFLAPTFAGSKLGSNFLRSCRILRFTLGSSMTDPRLALFRKPARAVAWP